MTNGYSPATLKAEADALEAAAVFVSWSEAVRMQSYAAMLRIAADNTERYRRFALTFTNNAFGKYRCRQP